MNVSHAPASSRQGNFSFALSIALLLLRLSLGATFIYHGSQKIFGAFDGPGIHGFASYLHLPVLPEIVWAWMAACSEFGCGILMLIGLLARLASIPLIVTMLVAIGTVTGAGGFSLRMDPSGRLLALGYEMNLMVIAMAATILLVGPGLISVDAFIFRCGFWSRGPQPLENPEPRSSK